MTAMGLAMGPVLGGPQAGAIAIGSLPAVAPSASGPTAGSVGGVGGAGYGLEGTAGGATAAADRAALGDGGAGGMMMVSARLERDRAEWREKTLNARRVYVGNVNATVTTTESIAAFISDKVAARGCTPWHSAASGTRGVEHCHVSDKGYAFLECTAMEDVEAVLALDGVLLDDRNIKIRRPKDYVADDNPLVRDGTMDTNRRNTYDVMISPRVPDSPTKVFLGNVDPAVSVVEARELITAFGNVNALHADVDGRGRIRVGIWFEYEDPTVAAVAVPGLTGIWLKGKRLVAALATPEAAALGTDPRLRMKAPATYRVPADAEVLMYPPQRVLEFDGILVTGMDDVDREAAVEDCRQECLSLGNVLSTHVEGPSGAMLGNGSAEAVVAEKADGAASVSDGADGDDEEDDEKSVPGKPDDMSKYWGKVYVEFARIETATMAAHAFHRRSFDGRTVAVRYIPLSEYQRAFGKGLPPKTHAEKQKAAMEAMEYLVGSVPESGVNSTLLGV